MEIGIVGGSYTSRSTAIADEECINWYLETTQTAGPKVNPNALYGTPGLRVFNASASGPRSGQCFTGTRHFSVVGTDFVETFSDGSQAVRGTVVGSTTPASIVASNIQILVVSGGRAYCFTLATNVFLEVTGLLVAVPVRAAYSDGYFIVCFQNSNKFQISAILDGTTWPGIFVNAVSVFPENVNSIIVNHRELWVFGLHHIQPYQDTGSNEVFDVIPGALIELGNVAPFGPCLVDNSIFWIDESERGARSAWRANGYTPQRISTYAVETDLATYADLSGLTTYAYQEAGHQFWVLYIPGAQWSWVFDAAENIWHKRAEWNPGTGTFTAHRSWNHSYAFGKSLVGDWKTGNLNEMNMTILDDNGVLVRRLRRAPILGKEMQWIRFPSLTLDFDTGESPQPPLLDGNNAPRPAQVMVRWSDNRGKTWSNEHLVDCGFAGDYTARSIIRRLGRSRYRVFEIVVTDPIKWALSGAYIPDGAA